MKTIEITKRPSKSEQKLAMESYSALNMILSKITDKNPEIEIEETHDKITIPINALKLLEKILKELGQGKPVSIVPIATEVTTQAAAELIGCSRPHIVKLLENGEINYVKVGKHRRIKYEDLLNYKKKMKRNQFKLLGEIMESDEKLGLYDS